MRRFTSICFILTVVVATTVESDARRRPEVVQHAVDSVPYVLRVRVVQNRRMPGLGRFGTCAAQVEILEIIRAPTTDKNIGGRKATVSSRCWNFRDGQVRPIGGSFVDAQQLAQGLAFAAAFSGSVRAGLVLVPESYQPFPGERQPWQPILR
jgi:hypothetical protein